MIGLDAVSRSLFYNQLLEEYTEHPRTVVLSTHLIDEVSRLLERVLVLDEGKLILDEEVEALRGRAFTVTGPEAKVETYTAGKEVLERIPFGSQILATVLGSGNTSDRQQAETLGLEITPVSLQQLIVHLTRGQSEREEVEVK